MRRNPWLGRRVLNYAHQGGAREAPSSTLFAMRQALAAGATALEMDVHRTSDGHLVVCHDATVDRTTEGAGRIADKTLSEVQALDNAYWFVPGSVVDHSAPPEAYIHRGKAMDDRSFRIPTLVEVLSAFPDTFLNLDIKTTKPDVPYEEQLAELLVEHGRTDDVIVASFHDTALDVFLDLDTGIGTSCGPRAVAELAVALVTGRPVPDEVRRHVAIQVPPRFAGQDVITEESIAAAHEAGLAVHVWTIDEPEEMKRLVALGVDGVMTDVPSVLTRSLANGGPDRTASRQRTD